MFEAKKIDRSWCVVNSDNAAVLSTTNGGTIGEMSTKIRAALLNDPSLDITGRPGNLEPYSFPGTPFRMQPPYFKVSGEALHGEGHAGYPIGVFYDEAEMLQFVESFPLNENMFDRITVKAVPGGEWTVTRIATADEGRAAVEYYNAHCPKRVKLDIDRRGIWSPFIDNELSAQRSRLGLKPSPSGIYVPVDFEIPTVGSY